MRIQDYCQAGDALGDAWADEQVLRAAFGLRRAEEPMGIFEGLQRQGQEKGLCYVGSPKRYGDGWSAPGHKNMVFLVCLTKEMTIFEWGWEKEDRQNAGLPENAKQRFGKLIWKHSSNT